MIQKAVFTSTGEFWPSTLSQPFVAPHESGHASDLFAVENRHLSPSTSKSQEEQGERDASLS